MLPELFVEVSRNLADHEGRVLAMYPDSCSPPVVTCLVGHALFTAVQATQITWWLDTGRLATRDEVIAAWRDVGAGRKKRALLATFDESERVLREDLVKFEAEIRKTFIEVDTYPRSAQVALYDICFNCGSFLPNPARKYKGWPNFIVAVKARDWKLAASHSNRPAVGDRRNKATYDQLYNAT